MTYLELLNKLKELEDVNPARLKDDVIICDKDFEEFTCASYLDLAETDNEDDEFDIKNGSLVIIAN